MKKCFILTFDGVPLSELTKIASEMKKLKTLKKYEVLLSSYPIIPTDADKILELCKNLLQIADRMIKWLPVDQ